MAKDPFPIVPVAPNAPGLPEQLGTKEKFWIQYENSYSLIKFGRPNTGEDWAEKVVCELCALLGVQHAQYELANCAGRSCVLSPTFIPRDGRLVHGNELISTIVKQYDGTRVYQQREHTISRVLAALIVSTRPRPIGTVATFIGYLMLDAWVGNTDRHHENWGLIRDRDGKVTLAPTYDHASSLGRELLDDERSERLTTRDARFSVSAFASKARSAFYDNVTDRKALTTFSAFTEASKVYLAASQSWLEKLESVSNDSVTEIFDRVPSTVLTQPARLFASKMLEVNRDALLRMRRY